MICTLHTVALLTAPDAATLHLHMAHHTPQASRLADCGRISKCMTVVTWNCNVHNLQQNRQTRLDLIISKKVQPRPNDTNPACV